MTKQFVVRVSKGHFAPERCDEVRRMILSSAKPLMPALKQLRGLVYYHAGVDSATNTVVNVSVWVDTKCAQQMDTLAPMLAQRPILEAAGVQFDPIANYEPLWTVETLPRLRPPALKRRKRRRTVPRR